MSIQWGCDLAYWGCSEPIAAAKPPRHTVVIAIKPANLTFEEAAAVPGAAQTAWRCLQRGKIQPGQKILIYGASGAVGTNAVQLASRHFGADVTGVCSGANLALVTSLGASQVIDYTRQDFTQSGATYDVVFDAVGKLTPAQGKAALKPGGVYLNVHADSEAARHSNSARAQRTRRGGEAQTGH